MKAQPGPMVSGSHFLPKAPLLWVKWMPAWEVMSRNWMCWAELGRVKHGDTAAQRRIKKGMCFLEKNIYREAPAEIAAGLCPAGRPRAAVPTCVVVLTGSGTDMCSWTDWRSLLSSG